LTFKRNQILNKTTAAAIIMFTMLCAFFLISGCGRNQQQYSGDTENGLPHGSGTLFYAQDIKYVGHFSYGLRDGSGQWFHTSGITYSGSWKNDIYHDWGKLSIPDGTVYEGFWHEGKKEGAGTQYWPDGRRYEGSWKNGLRDGYGELYYPDGSYYKGEWQEGRMHGQGVLTTADGETLTGTWENGLFQYVPVAAIALDEEDLSLTVGQSSATLTTTILPVDATNQKVEWFSSEPTVAEVDQQGQVTPLSPGVATINALAVAEELETACRVTVKPPWVAVKDLFVHPPYITITLNNGSTMLRAEVLPPGASNKTVYWSSSDPEIVEVNRYNGRVQPLQTGVATITARAEDGGYTATCFIQVRLVSPYVPEPEPEPEPTPESEQPDQDQSAEGI
jgi:hypothetical protein